MKQPTLRHLKIDREGTELIRTALQKKGRVTITVTLTQPTLHTKDSPEGSLNSLSTHGEDASPYDGVPTKVDSIPLGLT